MLSAFQSGFASASLEVLFDKIATFAINEIGIILGVDSELEKLERTLLKIQALVDEVESKQFSHKAWRVWLHDLKSVFYDAEDLLDEISLEFMRLDADNSIIRTNKDQVRNMVLKSFNFQLPRKIKKIQKKLVDIVGEMDSLFMTEIIKLRQPLMMRRTHCSSFVDQRSVIGREKDKDEIIQLLLLKDEENDNLDVIPIVGMGGIGKTTLAQVVYNETTVVEKFDLRIWATVSIEFDLVRIMKLIVESAMEEALSLSCLDPIQVMLRRKLEGKKFLLVLDDMWNENPSDWDVLCSVFSVGAKESKILVTTRSTVVSSIVTRTRAYYLQSLSDKTPAYYLQPLSDEDCWALIKQRALSDENVDGHEKLVVIGQKIAKKCKGIPLAAKTLGSVLQFKTEEKQWEALLKSELWDLPLHRNDIFPALKLSFDHLHAPLKRCFAYCSIFPLDHEFEKDNLVQLWIAEGFVQPEGMRRLEDIGKDYFADLLWRSFFQFSRVDFPDKPIYKMHGLIHNLAQVVSADICFRMEAEMSCLLPTYKHARHASLLCQVGKSKSLEVFHKYKSLKTFMLFNDRFTFTQVPDNFFEHLRRLRVFDISCSWISELPNSIDKLKHLRYLDVSKTYIKKLPDSTAKLYGLQTLKLQDCTEFLQLPNGMKNLIKLEHLDLDIKRQLNSMPPEFGRLTSLQTLHAFIVGKGEGFRIEELKNMRDLCGSICITWLENVANEEEARNARLDNKPYLEKLELQWNKSRRGEDQEEVLAGLKPHNRLKQLQIKGYGGVKFPSWLSDPSFFNLGIVYLLECQYCEVLPHLGQLPFLESLCISKMYYLQQVDHQFCGSGTIKGFPSLKSLKFRVMKMLKKWEGLKATDMPHLRELTLESCSELQILPSLHYLTSLEKLQISYCRQVRSLPAGGLPVSLKELIIENSDILKERCKVEEGEDWSKIKTVPTIEIDHVNIPLQGRGN